MESPFVYVDFMNEYVDSEFEIITEGYFAIQLHIQVGFD